MAKTVARRGPITTIKTTALYRGLIFIAISTRVTQHAHGFDRGRNVLLIVLLSDESYLTV
jgi:hypothetical protein